jgi:AraC-like DNA-binding protein
VADGRKSQIVYTTRLVGLGRFFCATSDPVFADTGPIGGHLIVFPREAVTITHAGGKPIFADPTRVMFYHHGQEYRRAAVSPAGDRCAFLALPADAVAAASGAHAPRPTEPDRPFGGLTHGPVDAPSFLLARAIFRHAGAADPLAIDEAALRLLDHLVAAGWAAHGGARAPAATGRGHAELSAAARHLAARSLGEPLALGEVAAALGVSPFHLARVFRREEGLTLHAYRARLRLRAAADRILDGATDLTTLALDLGFSSHSHFTSAFRAAFGVAPSRLRQLPAPTLSKILTA